MDVACWRLAVLTAATLPLAPHGGHQARASGVMSAVVLGRTSAGRGLMAEEAPAVRWEPGPVAVVRAPEELDMATAGAVNRLLDSVLAREPVVLVVDMTGTRFSDSTAAAVLIRANKKAARAGASLRVAVTSPAVRRAFELLRLGQVVDMYPCLEAALRDVTPGLGPRGHAAP